MVRCGGSTVLNIIPEKEDRTLRLRFISRFSRRLPVTGDAYAGTLQNRTCFNDETGWLRNYISVPDGADFFYAEFSETGTSSYFTREEERMKVYKKLMNALAAVEKVVLVVTTLLILVLTVGNVFSRKVIHRSWSFTEELVVAVFVLITLLAAALSCREGGLVSLTLVTDRLPKKLKKPSVILITVLSIIFSVILFKYGMDKVITQLENGKRTFVLNWPEWIFCSFVPIGAGCMILHLIEYCLDVCFGNKNDKEGK